MLTAIYQSTWHNIPWTLMSFYGAHLLSSVMLVDQLSKFLEEGN